MPGSHPEAHYNSPDVFAVFSESKNLNLRSGIHVLTPTSRHTTAYVHRAENVKVGGGVFATGNGRDVEHVLSALPPWWQMPSTDRKFRSLDFSFFFPCLLEAVQVNHKKTEEIVRVTPSRQRHLAGPVDLPVVLILSMASITIDEVWRLHPIPMVTFRLDVSARVLNAIYVEFVLDESRPIARIQVRLADDTTFMIFLPILQFFVTNVFAV